MELFDAIYSRRSMRAYTEQPVGRNTVAKLLEAAAQAPSAMNSQPWVFAVIQNRALLRSLSDRAKAHLQEKYNDDLRMDRYRGYLFEPDFDVFYGAGTLIILCATPNGFFPTEDCCLAGENLMLAATALGLGTCCIGWTRPLLNLPEVKQELGIPADLTPVLPIIVGYPSGITPPVPKNPPRIVNWLE